MYNQPTCTSNDVITGWAENCNFDISAPSKLFFQDIDDSFASESDAKDSAVWGTKIASKFILPTPYVQEFDDNSEEDTYYTSPINAIDKFIREGKTKFKFRLLYDPCLYKRLRGLNGSNQRLIIVDNNNNVIGTSADGVAFKGVLSGTLRVEKWIHSDGSNPSFIPIMFTVESGIERNDEVAIFEANFNIKGLNGVQPASLTIVGTPSGTEIVVDVAQACDGTAITGITETTDFKVLKADGTTEEAVTVVAETGTTGRYTLTGVAFETGGTANLDDVITLGSAYYQGTAVAITF